MPEVIKKPADANDDAQYELKEVQTIRGTEARTITKWEKDGWELVAQDPGRVRTTLSFRRVKPKMPWRWMALAGGAMVLIIGAGIAVESQRGDGTSATAASSTGAAAATTTEAAPMPSGSSPEVQASQAVGTDSGATAAQSGAEPVLTAENNADLAAVLALSDPADAMVAQFAAAYEGRIIEFDGNVADMANHDSYDTRYDLLIGAGDFSTTSRVGPNFQFRDVNITNDLNIIGSEAPGSIGEGDNLHITAEVLSYNSTQELFLLEPVSTQFR